MPEQQLVDPIETDRLLIRRFELDDWRDVHAYASDAETVRYFLDFDGPLTEEQARAFVAENMGEPSHSLAVILKAERQLIGHMHVHPWFSPRIYEIGWILNKRYHGQGYATEAAAALLQYGFETLKVHRIIATCQPENVASYRVMEKIGMQREGHFRQCIERDETTWWDEYFYAILAAEWHQAEATRSSR